MRIGLTGGTGFIGQWLIRLYASKYEFVVLTSGNHSSEHFAHKNVCYKTGDYSLDSMKEIFQGCDCLVHLGAGLSTKEKETSFLNYQDNIKSSENLFETARNLGIKNVVNLSSRTVYDHGISGPYGEDMAPVPMNYYAAAKLAVEHIASLYNRRFDMKIKTLRLAQIFGPGGRGGYMMEVFRQKCEAGEQITVLDNQGKELLYVKDAAKVVLCACMEPEKEGIYNAGSGIFYTNTQIADAFCKVYGNKAGYVCREKWNKDPIRNYMNVSKACEELCFHAEYSLMDALEDMRMQSDEMSNRRRSKD